MNKENTHFWSNISYKIMEEVDNAITPLVGQKKSGKTVKMGADGTPTKLIDLVAEEKVIEILENTGKPLTLVSEEIGELKLGDGLPETIFVVDPLDGTFNAVKNIPAYGISLAIGDISNPENPININTLELGFVKNFASGDIYHAIKNGGSTLNGKEISISSQHDLSSSLIGAYIYRSDTKNVDKLSKMVRRMRILGSVAIELCYVAEGIYDAFLDVRGNQRIMDIAAAKLIVEEAGGIITDNQNQQLNAELNVLERTSIIASGNKNIHKELINILGEI